MRHCCSATCYGAARGAASWARCHRNCPTPTTTPRQALVDAFRDWQQLLAAAFERLRDNGALADDIDPAAMATSVMAAVQGGYLLAQLEHDSAPMKLALDMALGHVRSFQAIPDRRRPYAAGIRSRAIAADRNWS